MGSPIPCPYTKGVPCSACPSGKTCENNLCIDRM